MIEQLLDEVEETGESSNHKTVSVDGRVSYGLFQGEISDTATLILQGRLSPAAPWATVASLTESGAVVVTMFPEMRANVTAYTSGTVSAWIGGR